VVIVIVAILAAVAVPLYIQLREGRAAHRSQGAIGATISAEQVHFSAERRHWSCDLRRPCRPEGGKGGRPH